MTNGTRIEINETGTTMSFRPGLLVGGAISHDCGGGGDGVRAAGWFLEGIAPLAPFMKRPLHLTLENCVTNDDLDPSVDMLREVTLALLRKFGIGGDEETAGGLEVKIRCRGAAPGGGGLVEFRCPVVRQLRSVDLLDAGLVKRVRGVAYSTKVSPQVPNRMVSRVRGVLNQLLPDVYVYTDVYSGKTSGASPGFAVCLWAETTTGCMLSTEATAGQAALPEDVGQRGVEALLEEVWDGGCVDSTHQPLALLLMAVGPEDVARIRTGRLTRQAMDYVRPPTRAAHLPALPPPPPPPRPPCAPFHLRPHACTHNNYSYG